MISKEKKFLFIHIPKTGGNSIQNILAPFADEKIVIKNDLQDGKERFELENVDLDISKHSTLFDYKSQLDKDYYESLFKFSVIRNPFERLVSFYFSPHRKTEEWNRDEFIKLVGQVHPVNHFIKTEKESILTRILKSERQNKAIDSELDFLIRFENLNRDVKFVCNKLNIDFTELPHRNKSVRNDHEKYYDSELEALVLKKFADEIEFGNYTL